jgi:hypothetical protein
MRPSKLRVWSSWPATLLPNILTSCISCMYSYLENSPILSLYDFIYSLSPKISVYLIYWGVKHF